VLARKRSFLPEHTPPDDHKRSARWIRPTLGLVLGIGLLTVPTLFPSLWAAAAGGVSRDLGSTTSPAGNISSPSLSAPTTPQVGAASPAADQPGAKVDLGALAPAEQSVVFRPATRVLVGEQITIYRRLPSASRPRFATDTAALATRNRLANSGYNNGRLPASVLRRSQSGCLMYAPAAVAYDAMFAAAKDAGFTLEHSGCYRTYVQQVLLRQARCAQDQCKFAAVPGTSMHGWGLAVDFRIGNRALNYSDPLFVWLTANAGRFGYVHPHWARQGGNLQEPWHWEFGLPADPVPPEPVQIENGPDQ
jgi:hypothetical protein